MEEKKIVISGDMSLFCEGYSSVRDCLATLVNEANIKETRFKELEKRLIELEKEFIEKTKDTLKNQFNVEYLETGDIAKQFRNEINEELSNGNIIISLDRNYIKPSDFEEKYQDRLLFLDFTRFDNNGSLETVERQGFDSVKNQYENIVKKALEIMANNPETKVIVVDDVLFSGGTIKNVADELKNFNINTGKAIFAISVENAKGEELLTENGIKVKSIKNYEKLEDEICSRDFIFGLPQSGRLTNVNGEKLLKPYFLPFGDVSNASIPEDKAQRFSKNCLEFSRDFWNEIDKYKGQKTEVSDLPYGKPFIPEKYNKLSYITDILDKAIEDIDIQISMEKAEPEIA